MKKELYFPVKPAYVNQSFGQNANPVYAEQHMKGHNGVDFQASHGQKVYAAHDGTCYPTIDSHGGNGVTIISTDKTYKTIYWHLIQDDAVVHTGTIVKAGELIAYADSTGISTGDHCHFGLYPIPEDDFNGYYGAIDPQPYFNGLYAQDIGVPIPPPVKYVFTKLLRFGSWNSDVLQLQTVLKTQNDYLGALDGDFGPMTLTAVKAFQTAHSIIADGIVGPKTNAILNNI